MVDMNITDRKALLPAALRPSEVKYLILSLAIFVAVVVLAEIRSQAINWESFFLGYSSSLGLLAVGIYIRIFK
jgi:hypothetical protein